MNFRQRIAWLILVAYIGVSGLLVYYVFDVSDAWSAYAVDHVLQHHAADAALHDDAADSFRRRAAAPAPAAAGSGKEADKVEPEEAPLLSPQPPGLLALLSHIADIPWLALVVLCTCLYLQTFFALFACTQPDPRLALALSWPVRLHNFVCRLKGRGVSRRKGQLAHVLATVDCRSIAEAGQWADVAVL